MLVNGDEFAEQLAKVVGTCPKCKIEFSFQEGFNAANEKGVKDQVVACPQCSTFYTVHITPAAMELVQDVSARYAGIVTIAERPAAAPSEQAKYFVITSANDDAPAILEHEDAFYVICYVDESQANSFLEKTALLIRAKEHLQDNIGLYKFLCFAEKVNLKVFPLGSMDALWTFIHSVANNDIYGVKAEAVGLMVEDHGGLQYISPTDVQGIGAEGLQARLEKIAARASERKKPWWHFW